VNKQIKKAAEVADRSLKNNLRLTKKQKTDNSGSVVKANTVLVPLAVNSKGYLTETPDGKLILIPFADVQPIKTQVRKNEMAAKASKVKNAG
jgi:hypothetical protein